MNNPVSQLEPLVLLTDLLIMHLDRGRIACFYVGILVGRATLVFDQRWFAQEMMASDEPQIRKVTNNDTNTGLRGTGDKPISLLLPKINADLKHSGAKKISFRDREVTVCTCTKCGSTSLWSTVYNLTHGKKWDFDGRPWIHNLNSTRWDKVKVNAGSPAFARDGPIALIQDPKERMVSAWKSKAQCNREQHRRGREVSAGDSQASSWQHDQSADSD